jgi:predicted transport protein
MNNEKNWKIAKKTCIDSRYFKSKLNFTEILGSLEANDDIAIFVDEKILPEINSKELDYKKYLEIVNASICLGTYGKNNKLKTNELKSFVLIMIHLLYNNLNVAIVYLKNNEIKIVNRAIEFLNSLNHLKTKESMKVKLFIDFVLNNHEKEKELIKKSIMISPEHLEKINQVEGKGFSSKVRFILDSYFAENKDIVTEEKLAAGVDSKIVEIYKKLKKEILSWNNEIKFTPIKSYLIFSYYYRFLKIDLGNDKINLQLSFSEDKPFDDYKAITTEIKSKNKVNETNKIKKFNFSLDSYDDVDYALFLIKQSYENNNKDVYSNFAYNHTVHRLFNNLKRYEFPFSEKIGKNGLFVFFEKGEKFQDEDRIVYIGSNVKEGKLPKMINYIFKDGNRDNTTLRKNIGKSLLTKEDDSYIKKFNIHPSLKIMKLWDMDLKEFNEEYLDDSVENEQIKNIEEMVSQYIQDNFSFSIVEINNKLKRLHLKSKIISSLSLSDEFTPSNEWLGNDSPREKIRNSGLWLEQHLYNRENLLIKEDLEFFKKIIENI